MKLKEAKKEILIALQCYVDDCISTDKKAIKRIDTAWQIILSRLDNKGE